MCTQECPCWNGFNLYETMVIEKPKPRTSSGVIDTSDGKFDKDTYQNSILWTGYKGIDEMTMRKYGRTRNLLTAGEPLEIKDEAGIVIESYIPFVWNDNKFDKTGK